MRSVLFRLVVTLISYSHSILVCTGEINEEERIILDLASQFHTFKVFRKQ